MFTLAIVGRPNVGKSTLFNRLAGKRLAIVDNTPGVTRDWREAPAYLFDREFRIIDTAGLEESFDESIQGRMRKQTEAGLKQADAVLFVVDGRSGITPMDEHFADWLRRQKKPVILAVNKCEHDSVVKNTLAEAYALGLGDPIALSAEHGIGLEDIYHMISPYFPEEEQDEGGREASDYEDFDTLDEIEGMEDFEFRQEEVDPEKALKIAIVGRPNVGKSTLLNMLVGEERVMTGPEAGITRDAVSVDWEWRDRKFRLVDTAGMRKRARVVNAIEQMSVEDSMRAIRLANIVVLVIDATAPMEKQDIQIAAHVAEEGRGLVIAVNKWDMVEDRNKALEDIQYKIETSFGQMKDVRIVTLSALTGKNVDRLLERVTEVYDFWNRRVSTGPLNRWLRMMESRNPPPLVDGRPNRLKYMTQIKTRPPTFAVWVSRPEKLPDSYRRYLINGLRNDHDIPATPVRLLVRRSKNPFA